MADLIQYIKEEASRNLRLAEKTKGSRQRTHSIRAKHLQRAVAEIERLTTERDTAEANLERLQNKFEQVTGENVRLTTERSDIQAVVDEQAANEGLWFIAEYATEAYLQSELRRLHEVIEGKTGDEIARELVSGSPKPKGDKA